MLKILPLTENNSEVESLVEMVVRFADSHLKPFSAGDSFLPADKLNELVDHASTMGLLDASAEGFGLWSECARGIGPGFTLTALRNLARYQSSVAMYFHMIALGNTAALQLAPKTIPINAPFSIEGTLGLGRSSLSRWLLSGSPALSLDDRILLSNCFGLKDRYQLAYENSPGFWSVVYKQQKMNLCWFDQPVLMAKPAQSQHGFDSLKSYEWQQSAIPKSHVAIDATYFQTLLSMQLLGMVSIGLGLVDKAYAIVEQFVTYRKQGGHTIIEHDAVAALVADLEDAEQFGGYALKQIANKPLTELMFKHALNLKLQAMERFKKAINAAMQIMGGIGYMQETGIENLLRDINSLCVMSGAPSEISLILTTLAHPDAAKVEPLSLRPNIPGFLNHSDILSPFSAFQKLPLLNQIANYKPRSMWDEETRLLPRPLARYRRWVRTFAESNLSPNALFCDDYVAKYHQAPEISRHILSEAGRAGLLTDLLPAPIGSVPLTRYRFPLALQQAIRVEELARADGGLMLLLSAHNLGLAPLLFSGNLSVMKNVVWPAFRANKRGETQLFAFAITEPGAGSDAEDGYGAMRNKPGLRASRAEGGWQLNGRKVFISGGDVARWITAFAAVEQNGFESWTAFLVDTQKPGFKVARTEHKMGMRVSGAAEIEFDNYFVPERMVLGGAEKGWGLNRATLNFSRLPVAAMAVGLAQQATELAIEFSNMMTLANRPLIHYQKIQLQLADMLAETSAIRALVWQFARNWTPRQSQASIAKFYATDRAQVVIENAMDLMGNHSLLHKNKIEKCFRDNRLTRIFEGTNQINRIAVIEEQQNHLLMNLR